jgi:hypothetical protein
MGYTAGRAWIEHLRIDDVQMNDVLGLRLNVWTSIVLFVAALAYFIWSARRHPGREESVLRDEAKAPDEADVASADQPAERESAEGAGANDTEPPTAR